MERLPRETALLLALLAHLRTEWPSETDAEALETQLRAVGVSAAPGARFRVRDATPIDVKGLAIGDKLFVHFVGRDASTRLSLVVSEFAKPADGENAVNEKTHSRIGQWVVSSEILRWRLERSVYPLFRGAEQRLHASTSAGAELGRLPEPLLLRIAPFFVGIDYCNVTRTNKFLSQFADQSEIWKTYIGRDFPMAGVWQATKRGDVKAHYVKLHEKVKRVKEAKRRAWEALPLPDTLHHRFGPYIRPPSPDILRPPPPPFGW